MYSLTFLILILKPFSITINLFLKIIKKKRGTDPSLLVRDRKSLPLFTVELSYYDGSLNAS